MLSVMDAMMEKCDIYFDNALISKESLIKEYWSFLAGVINAEKRSLGFALHTGSICFDAVSIVAVGIGCLAYSSLSNDDVIERLQPDEMVIYKSKRYKWKGTESENGVRYIVLEEDGCGTTNLPYEKYKHLISPYYGEAQTTGGQGVRSADTERENFLAYLLGCPINEVPTEIDVSVVVVAKNKLFADICKKISIKYDGEKSIDFLSVISASYFSSIDASQQIGPNPSKAEPVLKAAGNISVAKKLVLDKRSSNKVVGLLVIGNRISIDASGDLYGLLKGKKAWDFALLETPLHAKFDEQIFELDEDAVFFACTKEWLADREKKIISSNKYTEELARQASLIEGNTVTATKISGGFTRDEYVRIARALYAVKPHNPEFVNTAWDIVNLLNTAAFSMSEFEKAVQAGRVKSAVKSPTYLRRLAEDAGEMRDSCIDVADAIEQQYKQMFPVNSKAKFLFDYIKLHAKSQNIAIIVSEAWHISILKRTPLLALRSNIDFVPHDKFDVQKECDALVVVGGVISKKFNPMTCPFIKRVQVLMYECEEKFFWARERDAHKYEQNLNKKIGITVDSPDWDAEADSDSTFDEADIAEDTPEAVELQPPPSSEEGMGDIEELDMRRLVAKAEASDANTAAFGVTHVGVFQLGERIFFSKSYKAVVLDTAKGTVQEKPPADLRAGDVLLFTARDDHTKNIVDVIHEKLLASGRLGEKSLEMYEKSRYWKTCLLEYMARNGFTYSDIAAELKVHGSSLSAIAVRQWLAEGSHIVGPREEETMVCIAKVTRDSSMLKDAKGYFTACQYVRGERGKILKWMQKAIHDKYSATAAKPQGGSVLEVVYNNIGKLAETKELKDVRKWSGSINIRINLINRPIAEAEVHNYGK